MIKYICAKCSAEYPKWMGKCTECDSWNSIEEISFDTKSVNSANFKKPEKVSMIKSSENSRISTGFEEFDRVLGGGIVNGEVILLSGDPGIGKSTLLLQSVFNLAVKKKRILYSSGEESEGQIALRAKRIATENVSIEDLELYIISTNSIENIIDSCDKIKPDLIIVDSIQTVESANVSGITGGVSQIKESTTILSRYAKSTNRSIIIVGHITKEGNIAGPKILEHLVDAVMYLEGDAFQGYRILRSIKNRYGAQGEIGVFQLDGNGMSEVTNPSELFINSLTKNSSGISLVTIMQGLRPLILEVQSLTMTTYPGMARRVANGMDYNRLQLLIAVISKVLGYKLQGYDIYVNIVGGLKVNDPSIDLGVCASIISSYLNKPIGQDKAYIGEIGLSGEVRASVNIDKRLAEIKKLGIKEVFVSKLTKLNSKYTGLKITKVEKVKDILSTFS